MIDRLPQDHTARSTSTGRAPLIVGLAFAVCVSTIGCGETSVDVLVGELESVNANTRYKAAKSLDALGDEAVEAVGALTRALDDESAKVRYRAAKTLAKIGPQAAPAVNALAARLQDDDDDVRYYAAKALTEIGPQSAPAVEALTAAIKDEDPKVRYYAIRGQSIATNSFTLTGSRSMFPARWIVKNSTGRSPPPLTISRYRSATSFLI